MSDFPIFGISDSLSSNPATFITMAGWFTVPPGYSIETDENQQVWATDPESGNRYACKMDQTGQLMFQDLLRSRHLDRGS